MFRFCITIKSGTGEVAREKVAKTISTKFPFPFLHLATNKKTFLWSLKFFRLLMSICIASLSHTKKRLKTASSKRKKGAERLQHKKACLCNRRN